MWELHGWNPESGSGLFSKCVTHILNLSQAVVVGSLRLKKTRLKNPICKEKSLFQNNEKHLWMYNGGRDKHQDAVLRR